MSCWSPTRAIRISPTVLSFWKSNWRSASCQGPARTARTITRIKIVEAKQIAEWLDALDRPDKQMLRAAVDGLIAALPDSPETGKNLQDLLRDSQRRNRWPIAYILAHLPHPPAESLEILFDALDQPDPDVRWAVILLLARLTQAQSAVMQLTTSLFASG